eukprot:Lankesteria_metandrocarpae@DN8106_c0_g1_i1.p1
MPSQALSSPSQLRLHKTFGDGGAITAAHVASAVAVLNLTMCQGLLTCLAALSGLWLALDCLRRRRRVSCSGSAKKSSRHVNKFVTGLSNRDATTGSTSASTDYSRSHAQTSHAMNRRRIMVVVVWVRDLSRKIKVAAHSRSLYAVSYGYTAILSMTAFLVGDTLVGAPLAVAAVTLLGHGSLRHYVKILQHDHCYNEAVQAAHKRDSIARCSDGPAFQKYSSNEGLYISDGTVGELVRSDSNIGCALDQSTMTPTICSRSVVNHCNNANISSSAVTSEASTLPSSTEMASKNSHSVAYSKNLNTSSFTKENDGRLWSTNNNVQSSVNTVKTGVHSDCTDSAERWSTATSYHGILLHYALLCTELLLLASAFAVFVCGVFGAVRTARVPPTRIAALSAMYHTPRSVQSVPHLSSSNVCALSDIQFLDRNDDNSKNDLNVLSSVQRGKHVVSVGNGDSYDKQPLMFRVVTLSQLSEQWSDAAPLAGAQLAIASVRAFRIITAVSAAITVVLVSMWIAYECQEGSRLLLLLAPSCVQTQGRGKQGDIHEMTEQGQRSVVRSSITDTSLPSSGSHTLISDRNTNVSSAVVAAAAEHTEVKDSGIRLSAFYSPQHQQQRQQPRVLIESPCAEDRGLDATTDGDSGRCEDLRDTNCFQSRVPSRKDADLPHVLCVDTTADDTF